MKASSMGPPRRRFEFSHFFFLLFMRLLSLPIKHNGYYRTLQCGAANSEPHQKRPIITLMFNSVGAFARQPIRNYSFADDVLVPSYGPFADRMNATRSTKTNCDTTAREELFLGVYHRVRELGEGGMGQVFLGQHIQTGAEVVIKVMRDHLADNPLLRAAFQREMEVMKRFRHPYAVALLDGSIEGHHRPCLILEYVHGVTLEALLQREGRMKPERVGRLLGQLCQVLHAAHGAGILHRDLSAANLMIVPTDPWSTEPGAGVSEHIKVMDFGLAQLGQGFFVPIEKLIGATNNVGSGTPDYMCPEHIRGDSVDERGDLYAVGVILYKMLTGQLPFSASADAADILLAHVQCEPATFAQLGIDDIPPDVEAVVQTCLAKYPNDRPQSARGLAERFGQALGQTLTRPEDFPELAAIRADQPKQGLELDRLEAWMPAQVAWMKLRAFIEGVGGEVVASEPGSLQVRIADPRKQPQKRGLLSFLGLGQNRIQETPTLLLELLMRKKQVGGRGLLEITVLLPDDPRAPAPRAAEKAMRHGFGRRICRELRAYLLTGQ
jgi:serine/threonine-protein kinase